MSQIAAARTSPTTPRTSTTATAATSVAARTPLVVRVAARGRGVLRSASERVVSRAEAVRDRASGTATKAHGALRRPASVFDDRCPGVANLDPALLRALRTAATDAARDGVEVRVNSGWRSPEYQDRLYRRAVDRYGSAREAARWVATAQTSAHVSGHAVDLGPSAATEWLATHGAAYGLCQIYRNEPWHYELRLDAIEHGRPPMYPDPSHDPRMWR